MLVRRVVAIGMLMAPSLAQGHEVLVEPTWCVEQKNTASGNPTPGSFPGPAAHFKMTNIELGSFDLGREIPALLGRNVRTRFWLMEPGGMIAEHCHADRPAFVYLLQGNVVETIEVDGKPVRRLLTAGQSVPERNGTRHWWINQTDENVLMVAVDIPNTNRPAPKNPPPIQTQKAETRDLEKLLLKEQYPHIPEVAKYKMQGRLVTIQPEGRIGLDYHRGRPGVTYVIAGTLLEYRSDQEGAIVRRQGDVSMTNNGIWNFWENKSKENAALLVVEFFDCGACSNE